tara:strand:+ start:438 stop:923 length:486 start_codon:yes stop_codon:yes gene_type:complete
LKNFFLILTTSNLLLACNTPLAYSNESDLNYFLKNREAIKLINEGNISEGEKKCDEMIEINPEGKWGYLCKGSSLFFSGLDNLKEEALKNFTKAIEIDPEYYEAYFLRGILQFSMPRKNMSKIDRNACKDIKKAYFNDYQYAINYVKNNKKFLKKDKCFGF